MATVRTKSEVFRVLRDHAPSITAFGVRRLGLFGSFVRDTAKADSDVDLYVEFVPDRKTLKNLMGLSRYLHEALGRKVEIVTPESLNAFTGKYITQEVEYVAIAA